jgi:hypothetical protein
MATSYLVYIDNIYGLYLKGQTQILLKTLLAPPNAPLDVEIGLHCP